MDKDCSPGPNSVYMPVRTEVRIAGVDETVLDMDDYDCPGLRAAQYADCWEELSTFSVDGDDPLAQPWFHEVTLTGGNGSANAIPTRTSRNLFRLPPRLPPRATMPSAFASTGTALPSTRRPGVLSRSTWAARSLHPV